MSKYCSLCERTIKGFGNNPAPLPIKGVVCDDCNSEVVIPARLSLYRYRFSEITF